LAVLGRLFGSVKLTGQALQDSAWIEPAALLASDSTEEARDFCLAELAVFQSSSGLNQTAAWLPKGGLAIVGRDAQRRRPSMVLALVDEQPGDEDNGELASIGAMFARAAIERT
jgi:hypothetical protein